MEEATRTKVKTKCEFCGKTIAGAGGKSLTSWLFRQAECYCEARRRASKELPKLVAETPGDEQSREAHSFKYQKGDVIGNYYQVLELIGFGGMGDVYRVVDLRTQSTFALKTISSRFADQKVLAKRLEYEADAARSLTHVNIAAVYDVSCESDGAPYLLMDYIEGQNLEELLKEKVFLKGDQALDFFIQIAEALEHAHGKGIIHRDLKPSNILLQRADSGEELVKLVDFGIAKIIDDATAKTRLTRTGEMIGSPLYMSPEQCKGESFDGRSDIYSLGCIMYEVVSGRTPFDGDNPMRVILKHVADPPPKVSKNVNIQPQFKTVIEKCLQKDPAQRYSSASELLMDLRRVQSGKSLTAVHEWQSLKTLWLRFVAFLIDAFISVGPAFVLFWLVAAALHIPHNITSTNSDYVLEFVPMSAIEPGVQAATLLMNDYPKSALLVMIVVTAVAQYLYFGLLESGPSRATVGKRLMGLSVVDLACNRISFGRASARFWGKTFVCVAIQILAVILVSSSMQVNFPGPVIEITLFAPVLAAITVIALMLRKRYQLAHDYISGCKVIPSRQPNAISFGSSAGRFSVEALLRNKLARWSVFLLVVSGAVATPWILYTLRHPPSLNPAQRTSWLREHVVQNTEGTEVDLPYMSLSDQQADDIARLRKVTKIAVSRGQLSATALSKLVKIPTLQELDLSEVPLTDSMIETLSSAKSLTRLNLNNTQISDESLKYLAPLEGLGTLDLQGTRMTGSWLPLGFPLLHGQ
jgi:serine/threonine protein kinase